MHFCSWIFNEKNLGVQQQCWESTLQPPGYNSRLFSRATVTSGQWEPIRCVTPEQVYHSAVINQESAFPKAEPSLISSFFCSDILFYCERNGTHPGPDRLSVPSTLPILPQGQTHSTESDEIRCTVLTHCLCCNSDSPCSGPLTELLLPPPPCRLTKNAGTTHELHTAFSSHEMS